MTTRSFYNNCKLKNSIFENRQWTQLRSAHSALIWPTFVHDVVMHYETFQRKKPATISETVRVFVVQLERHNTVSEQDATVNVIYRHFLPPCLQYKPHISIRRRTRELRSGKGRCDPSASPQTCVRGRVSVGEEFPILSFCHSQPGVSIFSAL